MDPFEGRMHFLKLLRNLSASQSSAMKVAQFAIKQKHLDEDLFSCVTEEINSTSLNERVNILYFLEALCREARRSGALSYVDMVEKDIDAIVEAVAPSNRDGSANIGTVRQVMGHFRDGDLLQKTTIERVESSLANREVSEGAADSQVESVFSKEDILKRMDQDRERHKRLRENIWMIPAGPKQQIEFNLLWESTSSLGDDDDEAMQEELLKMPL